MNWTVKLNKYLFLSQSQLTQSNVIKMMIIMGMTMTKNITFHNK